MSPVDPSEPTSATGGGGTPRMTDAEWYASRPAKWMAAGALIRDPLGRVLMVQPTYKPVTRLARRVRAAIIALETGTLVELEAGVAALATPP